MFVRSIGSWILKSQSTHLIRSMATPSKCAKLSSYIGTHDMTFHCDDVTACYMLKQLDRFRDHDIVRTRNPELLAKADIVVDVGGELDVDRLRLDHHQRSFNQTIKDYHPNIKTTNPNKAVRLSSSGLVYAIFGKDLIAKLLNLNANYKDLDQEKKSMVDTLFDKSYLEFFEEIDAIDNGVEIVSGEDIVYNYNINSGISSRVGRLNPIGTDVTPELRLEQFKKAMNLVGEEISEGIRFLADHWYPNRQKLRQIIVDRKKFDPSGQILRLETDQLIGWKSAIFDIEEELGIVGELKYVIYFNDGDASPWRATGVPASLKSFSLRVPLKEGWRGKRDEDLQSASGIQDATFVHMSGFTGGAKSLPGILSMIKIKSIRRNAIAQFYRERRLSLARSKIIGSYKDRSEFLFHAEAPSKRFHHLEGFLDPKFLI